jgi:hypothetical protein
MATIRARKQADGSTRYTAIVRIRKGKTTVHQEYKTFAHRVAAVTWAKHREVVLEDPSALTRVQHGAPSLAALIRWYIDTFETISKWQRSKQAHLELLVFAAVTSQGPVAAEAPSGHRAQTQRARTPTARQLSLPDHVCCRSSPGAGRPTL